MHARDRLVLSGPERLPGEEGLSPGPLALVGSGEYLSVMAEVEGFLLAGRAPRYVQLPTAAAQEGERSLRRWLDLGAAQASRLGVEQVPVLVRDRAEADSPGLAGLVEGAGLIYLSGGSPSYLAQTLRGTAVWRAILAAWRSGAALAGCSAGAMALTGWVPAMRALHREPDPGLGLLPWLRVPRRVRPPWRSRLSWSLRVSKMASTHCLIRPGCRRCSERGILRRRQRGARLVERIADQISEHPVRQPLLVLRRTRLQKAAATRLSLRNAGKPERSLPDPGFTLDDQRDQTTFGRMNEAGDELKFP